MALKTRFSKFLFSTLILILVFHAIFNYFYIYWRVLWIDSVMHFFGGAWVAFFAVWFFYYSGKFLIAKAPKIFFITLILGFTALVGIFWEFFEFLFDQFITIRNNMDLSQIGVKDTMSDLFFDLIGGFSVILFFINKFKRDE